MYKLHHGFDPEGVLSSLNSIVICLLGVQAGRVLVFFRGRHIGIVVRFIMWGVLLVSTCIYLYPVVKVIAVYKSHTVPSGLYYYYYTVGKGSS